MKLAISILCLMLVMTLSVSRKFNILCVANLHLLSMDTSSRVRTIRKEILLAETVEKLVSLF